MTRLRQKVMAKEEIIGNKVGQIIHRVSKVILKILDWNYAIIVVEIIIMKKTVFLRKVMKLKGLGVEVEVEAEKEEVGIRAIL